MTCIIGALLDNGTALMVSDDAMDAPTLRFRDFTKLWQPYPGMIMGVAGDATLACQFYSADFPILAGSKPLEAARGLAAHLTGISRENTSESTLEVLLMKEDCIFYVSSDGVYHRIVDQRYWAIGSGEQYALGYLYEAGLEKRQVYLALEAAGYFCPSVGELGAEESYQYV